MGKVMTLGNGLMLQIAVLCDSIRAWLNGKSELFTVLINEGKDGYEKVFCIQNIHLLGVGDYFCVNGHCWLI